MRQIRERKDGTGHEAMSEKTRAMHARTDAAQVARSICPYCGIGCGFHEAVRGVLSHHLVIRDQKIANYHPYPPTPWDATPRDIYGTPGPYEDAVQNTPIFEENGPDKFKGIDIMRAVAQLRSLSAVRRSHVRRQRQSVEENAHAYRPRGSRSLSVDNRLAASRNDETRMNETRINDE